MCKYIYIYIECVYIYIYIDIYLSKYIYIYVYIYIFLSIYIYICNQFIIAHLFSIIAILIFFFYIYICIYIYIYLLAAPVCLLGAVYMDHGVSDCPAAAQALVCLQGMSSSCLSGAFLPACPGGPLSAAGAAQVPWTLD